jgi:oxygen-independent coproporphyrinogen III oxidase
MSLGVYIQVPFCQTKCSYCNFHTGVVSRERYEPYAEAVCREIRGTASANRETVDSVYLGGGTPSLLDARALATILDTLGAAYRVDDAEITLEADPETVTSEKASAWHAAGFNRISLGAQSFEDRELRAAGRMHRRRDIFRAAKILRAAGFHNTGIDLIAGLAHQTRASWEESVKQVLGIRPEHVSVYILEIDADSRLGKESLAGGSRYSAGALPDEDSVADFYEFARERLVEAGYEHYEISNWALQGKRSRHNQKYWRREPYAGFGAGAHAFDGISRWANAHEWERYVACMLQGSSPREQSETLLPMQVLDEEMFLGLRMLEGIDFTRIDRELRAEVPKRIDALRERIEHLRSLGFLEVENGRIRLVPDRLTVSNEVFVQLLS